MALNDLQTSLIVLGGGLVVVVFAYNKWQEGRARRKAEQALGGERSDVLLNPNSRIEPSAMDEGIIAVRTISARTEKEGIELTAGMDDDGDDLPAANENLPDDVAASEGSGGNAQTVSFTHANALIEDVVSLTLGEPTHAGALWVAQQALMGSVSKPLRWFGFNTTTSRWVLLADDCDWMVKDARLVIQLADRRGPMSAEEFNTILGGLQQLADKYLAVIDYPEHEGALNRARTLDEFCASVDVQIGVNVISKAQAFAGTKLRGLAESAGMVIGNDGVMHARSDRDGEQGATLYTLGNLETAPFTADGMRTLTSHGITFTLDVPRSPRGHQSFDAMLDMAQRMTSTLGGEMVDDNRNPLTPEVLDLIRKRIIEVQTFMTARGMTAGSEAALRVFS